ncbi:MULTISPECIES: hypothetical protein [Corynebacterium]|uniref:hypothetical protein n=1 Tax=Corynebacterium TaxID=1716 RepID=UPI00124D5BEE|nr:MULTISPECIES: hypothetical protein [Corynebacterium]
MSFCSEQRADLSALSREQKVAALRAQLVGLEGGGAARPAEVASVEEREMAGSVRLPQVLAGAIAGGGLPRRGITLASDCPALVASLVAYVSAQGQRVALVGWDDLLLAEVPEEGGLLENIIVVRGAAEDTIQIAAVLAEGMDVVVAYLPALRHVGAAAERALRAKLRRGDCAVILVGGPQLVANAELRLGATPQRFHGMDMTGRGRITGVDIAVQIQQRGLPARTVHYELRGAAPAAESAAAVGEPEIVQLQVI